MALSSTKGKYTDSVKTLFALFVVVAVALWLVYTIKADTATKVRDAERKAIANTMVQVRELLREEQETASRIRTEQAAKLEALDTSLKAIAGRTKALEQEAKEIINRKPEYQEKLDAEGIALWLRAREEITKGSGK